MPRDGTLPEGGLIPAFIEWSPGPRPSKGQQDIGLRLETVRLRHPDPNALRATLKALGVDHLATVEASDAASAFDVTTPKESITLDLSVSGLPAVTGL